jgi:hypothetical protein
MKPIRFVSARYLIVWHINCPHPAPSISGFRIFPQVLIIRLLEETAFVKRLAVWTVVFHGKQPMLWGALFRLRKRIWEAAMRARAPASTCGPFQGQDAVASLTLAKVFAMIDFVKFTAARTDNDVPRMPLIPCQEESRKEIKVLPAALALLGLDPKKVFDSSVFSAAL